MADHNLTDDRLRDDIPWIWGYIFSIILLALGFGFVIFWHELGHFLAAKWAGVKVEQFAVGFGTAALAWRKGIGVAMGGSTASKVNAILSRERELEKTKITKNSVGELDTREETDDQIMSRLGIGETEYRLNWLPLGGYVKMLGQDDLNPNAIAADPRAYNMQPISKRMVIVSAGVVMNIILAAIGFFLLFLYGFNAPPAIVGQLAPLSPAQQAGLNVGDRILKIDGEPQADFTKIQLNVALLKEGDDVRVEYLPAGAEKDSTDVHTTTIKPLRNGLDMHGMLALGIGPPMRMVAIDPARKADKPWFDPNQVSPAIKTVQPGESIVAIAGQKVDPNKDLWKLDRALQASEGKPFAIKVQDGAGKTEDRTVQPIFDQPFADLELDIAGMEPRAGVRALLDDSPALGELLPDDVILSISRTDNGDQKDSPSSSVLRDVLNRAGQADKAVTLTVLRDGKTITLKPIVPSVKVDRKEGRMGLRVSLALDEAHAVVGDIEKESPAARAGIPQGATIVSVDGHAVSNWYEVRAVLKDAKPGHPIAIVAKTAAGEKPYEMTLSDADLERVRGLRYTFLTIESGLFKEYTEARHTTDPFQAAAWGVGETRDLIVQFYLTLKRMAQRSVPASNLMGPVGIVTYGSRFAYKGNDYLIWFLSMISANLAVVNFLPIPIVDGGLFLFLIIEKLQGKPLSPRTQSIAQVVGLALILSVFIFVTYQDIMR